jgi:ParB family chromosome partitioning protein
VRTDTKLDSGFVTSIRERGVLEPIVCYPGEDGLVVQFGQRRCLAALQSDRDTVPVFVVAAPEDVDRVTDQIIENDQRADLSTAERVRGWEQLAAFGLSASAIAKRTGAKKSHVETGLRVAGSELATKAGERWNFLTLDQVSAVAEFDADPDAVKAIVAAAKSGQFDHTLQRLRDDRAEADAHAAVRTQLMDEGVVVIERDEVVWPVVRLDNHGIDHADHTVCPGHAAYVGYVWSDGTRAPAPIYLCRDGVAHGHVDAAADNSVGGKMPMTEEEKAERKVTIERNKEWRSATTVRRDWLRMFVARKTAPAGSEQFIATCLLRTDHTIRQALEAGWPLLRELLGHTPNAGDMYAEGRQQLDVLVGQIATASGKRATLLTVGALLCAWEAQDRHPYLAPADRADAALPDPDADLGLQPLGDRTPRLYRRGGCLTTCRAGPVRSIHRLGPRAGGSGRRPWQGHGRCIPTTSSVHRPGRLSLSGVGRSLDPALLSEDSAGSGLCSYAPEPNGERGRWLWIV